MVPLGSYTLMKTLRFLCWGRLSTCMWGFGIGGVHYLALIPHVALLGLLGFWEVPVQIVYGEQWPGELVTVPDAIEPRCFCGKPCGRMELLDCARQAWELIHVVDSLSCCLIGIESLDVIQD